ncbi:hypothetical protein E2C01_072998 [Portunus trituberculatus]|uniref:Uncharacterized protein n=1 Tax=Portunus trituberculatus TaxID=210409 RepID=A0A5B7I1L8_PORTR|nr:hypothetical protein [Portunus trituberculatus]
MRLPGKRTTCTRTGAVTTSQHHRA